MNKKIGVITFHKTYNYGAALQAYATVVFLNECGFGVDIIDYYPNNLQEYGTLKNSFLEASNANRSYIGKIISALIKTPSYKRLKKQFDEFINNELPVTKPYYSSMELVKDLPQCDYFCTGSDQVWNNYYTHHFDEVYFLDFVPDKYKCFSIAASFGKETFSEKELEYIKRKLVRYDYISIREKAGINIAKGLGFDKAELMLDPTLLVDRNIWKKFAESYQIDTPYILVYQLHGDSNAFDVALQYGKKKRLKVARIITMYHQMRPGCINIIVPSVHQFIGLIKGAEYIFTDSFHGTVFSHIFEKKVGITLPSKFGNRIITLLSEIGTEKFIINDLNLWDFYVNAIDYEDIRKKLDILCEKNRNKLKDYLELLK